MILLFLCFSNEVRSQKEKIKAILLHLNMKYSNGYMKWQLYKEYVTIHILDL